MVVNIEKILTLVEGLTDDLAAICVVSSVVFAVIELGFRKQPRWVLRWFDENPVVVRPADPFNDNERASVIGGRPFSDVG